MHTLAPRYLPPLALLRADLGNPSAHSIARHLAVTPRTVFRWIEADAVPRPAHLALFYESTWGRSAVECEAVNQTRQAVGMLHTLRRENDELRAALVALQAVSSTGAANAPVMRDFGPPRGPEWLAGTFLAPRLSRVL